MTDSKIEYLAVSYTFFMYVTRPALLGILCLLSIDLEHKVFEFMIAENYFGRKTTLL